LKTADSVSQQHIPSTAEIDEASLDFVYAQVNLVLAVFCEQQTMRNADHPTAKLLWETLTEVIVAGGKRMRPYLVSLAYQACGGNGGKAIIQVGAGWELLHQSLLIHDDIIDRDYVRHGQLNVAGAYKEIYQKRAQNEQDTSHYANSAALLAGDLALSSAYQLILNSDFTADQKISVLDIMGKALDDVAGGELQDTESVMDAIGQTNSLEIAELKTASYSFVGPLKTGALLAGADQATIDQFGKLGVAIGIAFQLRDDLLSLFGQTENTGKSNQSDVREGKRTLLLQYAFEASDEAGKDLISRVVGNPSSTDVEVESFRQLVIKTGAKAKVEALINDYSNQAQTIVTSLTLDPRFTQKWQQFTQFILKREK